METQLYARIKRTSKYYYQSPMEGGKPLPFEVQVSPRMGEYCVFGNSNQYRLVDLTFHVVADGHEVRLR